MEKISKVFVITNIVTLLILGYVAKKSGYIHKLKIQMGILIPSPEDEPDYWAVKGWGKYHKKIL